MTARDLKRVAKKYYKSYPARDRKTTDGLVSDDFRFTGPLDNRLDRQTDFEHCGAAGRAMAAIEIKRPVTEDDHVFVTYEIRKKDGGRVRNTELLTLRDGQIVEVEGITTMTVRLNHTILGAHDGDAPRCSWPGYWTFPLPRCLAHWRSCA
jgi:ketosteroid isomerase-like protein